MIRGLFLLPLLLCVGGWGWSVGYHAILQHTYDESTIFYGTRWGSVYVVWDEKSGSPVTSKPSHWSSQIRTSQIRILALENPAGAMMGYKVSFGGFHYFKTGLADNERVWTLGFIGVPYWFLMIFFAGGLLFVWRKTRGKASAETAFPVEISGD